MSIMTPRPDPLRQLPRPLPRRGTLGAIWLAYGLTAALTLWLTDFGSEIIAAGAALPLALTLWQRGGS